MSASIFKFKQFSVSQDRCAMKVGTDGVLLGAWASPGMGGPAACRHILDIGTGTGLIALMMAQRFPQAHVVAIDINGEACRQARENVAASPFADRIEVVHTGIQEYPRTLVPPHSSYLFDAIVCNPPFFENSLKNPDRSRAVARHTDTLSRTDLFRAADALLADDGVFSVIVPADSRSDYMGEAAIFGFYVSEEIKIQTTPAKPPKRCLLSFVRHSALREERIVALCDAAGHRSAWYHQLTHDFYLAP